MQQQSPPGDGLTCSGGEVDTKPTMTACCHVTLLKIDQESVFMLREGTTGKLTSDLLDIKCHDFRILSHRVIFGYSDV